MTPNETPGRLIRRKFL